jgi:DNA modification methylase
MNLSKLLKKDLLLKCEELKITKYKSKNKTELINLIKTKLIENEDEKIEDNIEINKIYNEDCIIGMKKIKNEYVDIIICDPPYNIGKDFGNDSDNQDIEKYLNLKTLLLVPFAGSNSEYIAAKNNNIDFIDFELNKDYIDIANQRLDIITS